MDFSSLGGQVTNWLANITQHYGQNQETGIDVYLPYHTPVYALASGPVLATGYYSGGGVVSTEIANDKSLYYQHLSDIAVSPSQQVQAGDLIGYSGGQIGYGDHPATGNSSGPHIEVGINAPYGANSLWHPLGNSMDVTPFLNQFQQALALNDIGTRNTGTGIIIPNPLQAVGNSVNWWEALKDWVTNPMRIVKLTLGVVFVGMATFLAVIKAEWPVIQDVGSTAAKAAIAGPVGAATASAARPRPRATVSPSGGGSPYPALPPGPPPPPGGLPPPIGGGALPPPGAGSGAWGGFAPPIGGTTSGVMGRGAFGGGTGASIPFPGPVYSGTGKPVPSGARITGSPPGHGFRWPKGAAPGLTGRFMPRDAEAQERARQAQAAKQAAKQQSPPPSAPFGQEAPPPMDTGAMRARGLAAIDAIAQQLKDLGGT